MKTFEFTFRYTSQKPDVVVRVNADNQSLAVGYVKRRLSIGHGNTVHIGNVRVHLEADMHYDVREL